jgi:hypothetical protein
MEYERFNAFVAPHTDAMAHVAAALVGGARWRRSLASPTPKTLRKRR